MRLSERLSSQHVLKSQRGMIATPPGDASPCHQCYLGAICVYLNHPTIAQMMSTVSQAGLDDDPTPHCRALCWRCRQHAAITAAKTPLLLLLHVAHEATASVRLIIACDNSRTTAHATCESPAPARLWTGSGEAVQLMDYSNCVAGEYPDAASTGESIARAAAATSCPF